jgi:hypothetical protein
MEKIVNSLMRKNWVVACIKELICSLHIIATVTADGGMNLVFTQ